MPVPKLSEEQKAKMKAGKAEAIERKRKRRSIKLQNLEHTPTHQRRRIAEDEAPSEASPTVKAGLARDENQGGPAEDTDDEDFGDVGLQLFDEDGEAEDPNPQVGEAQGGLGLDPQASSPRVAVEITPALDNASASVLPVVPAEDAQVENAQVEDAPSPTKTIAAAPESNLGVEEKADAAAEPMREPSPVPVSSSSGWKPINGSTASNSAPNPSTQALDADDVFGLVNFDEDELYDDVEELPRTKTVLPSIASLLPSNFASLTPATTVQHHQPPPPPFPLAVPSLNASLDKVHLPPPGASYVHAGLSPSPSRSVLTSATASPLKSPAARRSDFVPYPIEFQYEYLEQGVVHRKQFTHLVVPVSQHHVIDHTWPARKQPSVPLLRQAPIKPFDDSQMTTLISHAGGIDAPVPCDRCANDVGKIVKCRLQPYWLDGCMSCRFNSQTNKCSLRDQSKAVKRPARQKRPQPGDEARLAELVAEIKGFRVLRFDEDFFRDMDADIAEDMVKEAAVVTEFARISSRLLKKSKGVDKALGRGRKGDDKSSK